MVIQQKIRWTTLNKRRGGIKRASQQKVGRITQFKRGVGLRRASQQKSGETTQVKRRFKRGGGRSGASRQKFRVVIKSLFKLGLNTSPSLACT